MANRLTDLDHLDELNRMKSRMLALYAAADSMAGVSAEVFEGFEVEVIDMAEGARPGLDDPLAQEFARLADYAGHA